MTDPYHSYHGVPITKPEAHCSNLFRHRLETKSCCHGGIGSIAVFRPFQRHSDVREVVDFIDLIVIPPGSTIGRHRHANNTEWYVILSGQGRMWFDGVWRAVHTGDILVNSPYDEHELCNQSNDDIQLLVFQTSHGNSPDGH